MSFWYFPQKNWHFHVTNHHTHSVNYQLYNLNTWSDCSSQHTETFWKIIKWNRIMQKTWGIFSCVAAFPWLCNILFKSLKAKLFSNQEEIKQKMTTPFHFSTSVMHKTRQYKWGEVIRILKFIQHRWWWKIWILLSLVITLNMKKQWIILVRIQTERDSIQEFLTWQYPLKYKKYT